MADLLEKFGIKVFDDKKMKEMLPSPVYDRWVKTIHNDGNLDRETADAIAHAMKTWALANGCTHYTHWFQPLTGVTAEKHDSFIDKKDDNAITKFSGKNLIKGEPDASSFPSGGLRATFEARGYTYWDCTSPAFIKDHILCIPTIFLSYNGESLDTKKPLLKSIEFVSKAATRVLQAFGDKKVTYVKPVIGLEQEYFLIDIEDFKKRSDLVMTGKTLFGTLPSKGQELETHYFGSIPSRVQEFMKEVNDKLWELGIYAKSEHNEVAPGQFELAPIFKDVNVAVDENLLIMEILQKTALKHNMVCLLHEKPFKGVNGSGKHNNYSLVSDTGTNVFAPGKNPHDNIQFMTFVSAFIKAIDEHADLIRLFSSCPGNDYRLGANEAPPAIVSIFLGDAIEKIFDDLTNRAPKDYKKNELKEYGISTLSYLPHDNSDRNRTSPVAFTGNKFEVRMLGSSMSAGYINIVLNTIMGEALNEIADKIEAHKYRQDIRKAACDICVDILKEHEKILFSGDGYSEAWVKEAERRGLLNIKTYEEAIQYVEEHNGGKVFVDNNIFTKDELNARFDIMYESYYKIKSIEMKTTISMMRSEIYPVVNNIIASYLRSGEYQPKYLKDTCKTLSSFIDDSYESIVKLEEVLKTAKELDGNKEMGLYLLKEGVPYMEDIRNRYDEIEDLLDKYQIPYPIYNSLFFKLDY